MKKNAWISIVAGLLVVSCGSNEPEQKPMPDWDNAKSTKMNKDFAKEEDIQIRLYLARHDTWKVESTGSGLRYIEMQTGTGNPAVTGQDAKVQYVVSLLDGTECYRTKPDELEVFRIDKSAIETGIQEGIKKMRVGGKSKLIIPSHLAHGLIGDMDKIPPLTPIIVDIELIELI